MSFFARTSWVLLALPVIAAAQDPGGTREFIGQLGSRTTLLTLHATRNPDGSWQLAGEYLILPTLQRRYLEGESSAEIGVTTLREGLTPILFGRPPPAELRGVWRGNEFRGSRFASGGQERERFEFSEEFPSLEAYTASVHCEVHEGAYRASLSYAIKAGKVQSFDWRARGESGGACSAAGLAQQPMKGGVDLAAQGCRVTLRDLREGVRVAAEGCSERCGGEPTELAPLLVDRRGECHLLRPQPR
jgi:hypothetical protein